MFKIMDPEAEPSRPPGTWWAPLPAVACGLLPFGAGTLLAGVSGFPLRAEVWGVGTVAVAALILAGYAAREIFAPGAGQCPSRRLAPFPSSRPRTGEDTRPTHLTAYFWLGVAAALGLLLQLFYRTGDLTIPLGTLGVLGGYFSFVPPLAWHRRGLGEAAGGLCFGLLPVAAGYYLQCGYWVSEVFLYGILLSCSAFNLFLINGFPRPEAQASRTPGTLAQRWGPVAGALIYTLANVLLIAGLAFSLLFPAVPLPFRVGFWLLLVLALANQELIKRRAYREEGKLRLLGLLTLTFHLAMGLVVIISLWQRL